MDLGVRDTLRWARWALEDVVVENTISLPAPHFGSRKVRALWENVFSRMPPCSQLLVKLSYLVLDIGLASAELVKPENLAITRPGVLPGGRAECGGIYSRPIHFGVQYQGP